MAVAAATAPMPTEPMLQSHNVAPAVARIKPHAQDVVDHLETGHQPHLTVHRGKELLHRLFGVHSLALVMREQLDRCDIAVRIGYAAGHQAAGIGLCAGCFAQARHEKGQGSHIQNQPAEERQQQAGVETAGDQGHGQEVHHYENQDVGDDHHRVAHSQRGLHHLGGNPAGKFVLIEAHALAEQMPVEIPAQAHGEIAVQSLVFDQRLQSDQHRTGGQDGDQDQQIAFFLSPKQVRRHLAQPIHDVAEHGEQDRFKSPDQCGQQGHCGD